MFNPPLLFEQNSYLCRKYENSNEKDIPHPHGRFAHGFPFGFGLLAYSRGFVRTEDSYDKAFGKGAALTLLTLGSYTVIPHKYETHGGVIIVDSLNDNIAYVTTGAFEYHPLKADTYKKLMIELVRVFRKRYS